MYPGLCEWDFEEVIAIIAGHLLKWLIDKKCNNKEGEGSFGDLRCCSNAVEQGQKILHVHFLLCRYIKMAEFTDAAPYNTNMRQKAKAKLQDYIVKVLTAMLHVFPDSVPCVCPPMCLGTQQDPTPCMHHVYRISGLYCKDGSSESSLGGKAFPLCG